MPWDLVAAAVVAALMIVFAGVPLRFMKLGTHRSSAGLVRRETCTPPP